MRLERCRKEFGLRGQLPLESEYRVSPKKELSSWGYYPSELECESASIALAVAPRSLPLRADPYFPAAEAGADGTSTWSGWALEPGPVRM